jgi:hypothetical protein
LDKAIENAKTIGFKNGQPYPMVTMNGRNVIMNGNHT